MSNTNTMDHASVLDVPVEHVAGQDALFPGPGTPADHAAQARATRLAALGVQVHRLGYLFAQEQSIPSVHAGAHSTPDCSTIELTVRGGLNQFTDTRLVARFLATKVVPYLADVDPEIWCVVDYERDGCVDWAAGYYRAGMTHAEFMDDLAW